MIFVRVVVVLLLRVEDPADRAGCTKPLENETFLANNRNSYNKFEFKSTILQKSEIGYFANYGDVGILDA